MKFLDKVALNRLIAIITSFILGIIKIFAKDIDETETPRRRPLEWLKRNRKK
jgi:hypothetical protein